MVIQSKSQGTDSACGENPINIRILYVYYGREIVHYEAPGYRCLKKEMITLLNWFEKEHNIDPVLKAALVHFWFVTIHRIKNNPPGVLQHFLKPWFQLFHLNARFLLQDGRR